MNRPESIRFLYFLFTLPLAVTPPLAADDATSPKRITLHPRGEPTPALRYRLLPGRLEQIPGNAAVYYGKVTAEEWVFFGGHEQRDMVDRWQETPLDELRKENIGWLTDWHSVDSLTRGGLCKYCDWQLPIGEVPLYTILLPEAQQSRSYARILAAKARLEIANGQFDDAVKTFQTNFALACNVAKGETIVNGLIGIAISQNSFPQILEYVQQPDAPNLYWALTELPTPFIDFRDALDVERMGVELSFPELRDIQSAQHTPEEWRALFHRLATDLFEQISRRDSPPPPTPDQIDERCQRMLPQAKKTLIASGLSEQAIEAMPTHQVALLFSLHIYHELLDDAIKYFPLPYPQASKSIEQVIERVRQEQYEIIPIAEEILPAVQTAKSATTRNDRGLAVLRLIEALRIYAASHQGKLPDRLEDITEVPIPIDPVTGQPFEYLRDGEKARFRSPTFRDVPVDYEIMMFGPD